MRPRPVAALLAAPLLCAAAQDPASLVTLSLEELGNLQVTSVSKRPERLFDSPASVYVITADEIRRSGAIDLPEALRLAPNLHVARQDAWTHAISARGFNGNFANKMLVLIDGRSVYTPLFSGVFWDQQDLVLVDVDRIEVISGPGGTLWGLNAMNGVINVITKTADQTAGALGSVAAGNQEQMAELRYGAKADGFAWRGYAKQTHRDHTRTAAGVDVEDTMEHSQVGLRADGIRGRDRWSASAGVYRGWRDQPAPGVLDLGAALERLDVSGGHLMLRWDRVLDSGDRLSLQGYYDRAERVTPPLFADVMDIGDLQFQHAMRRGAHSVVWGAQYRYASDDADNSPYLEFRPERDDQDWISLFAQDEIELSPAWKLTLGARVEHNDYTGWESLPNVRIAWRPSDDDLWWAAWSRPVRAPSRLDRDAYLPWPATLEVPGHPDYLLNGGQGFETETAQVLELGYKGRPVRSTLVSATVFHARYDGVRTLEPTDFPPQVSYGNGVEGPVYGFEMWGRYQPEAAPWKLQFALSRLWQDLGLRSGSGDMISLSGYEGANPAWRASLRGSLDLAQGHELDAAVRYVGGLRDPDVPGYAVVDLRWGWRPTRQWELSVSAVNLFNDHGEFGPVQYRTEFEPAVLFQVKGRF